MIKLLRAIHWLWSTPEPYLAMPKKYTGGDKFFLIRLASTSSHW